MSTLYSSGKVTAYGAAVDAGYTGTYEEFSQAQADLADETATLQGMSASASTLAAGSDATASYDHSTGVLSLGIPRGIPGDVANLATAYDNTKTYKVDDYCIYNNQLYRCTTSITTPESWTVAHWTAAVLGDDVSGLKIAVDQEKYGSVALSADDLVQGSYAWNIVTPNDKRISFHKRYPVWQGCSFEFAPGTKINEYYCRKYNASMVNTGNIGWTANKIIDINFDGYVIFVLRNSSEADITPSDYDATLSLISKDATEIRETNERIDSVYNDLNDVAEKINLFDKTTIVSGAYFNSSGGLTNDASSQYSTQYIPVDPSKKYSFTTKSGAEICTYDENKKYKARIPTPSSNLNQSFGNGVYYVRLSFYQASFGGNFMFVEGSTLPSEYVPYGYHIIGENILPESIPNSVLKSCKLIYNEYTGPYPGDYYHTERVRIYLPAKYGYVQHNLYHCVIESIYADVWKLVPSVAVDDSLTKRFYLTQNGEWELAIKLYGRNDQFVGGSTHGYETMTSVTFFIDGKVVDITDYTDMTFFDEFRVVETSNVYDYNDHTVVIGIHTREYVVNANGIRLRQTMKWAGAFPVENAYMPMYLALKTDSSLTVTNKLLLDTDYTPYSLPASNYNLTFAGAKNCVLYSEESGATQAVDCTWQKVDVEHSGEFSIADNQGLNYNKIYYRTVENVVYETAENELWKSEQFVSIDLADVT